MSTYLDCHLCSKTAPLVTQGPQRIQMVSAFGYKIFPERPSPCPKLWDLEAETTVREAGEE